ncbi:hypothetical protein ACFE04_023843 [Oxalis oulophora]
MWLKLGSVDTVVIQSANAASLFFKNHDANFCNRKCGHAVTALDFNKVAVGFVEYGAYWRLIRRLASMELLSNRKMNESAHIRNKCIHNMIKFIQEESTRTIAKGESGEVTLGHQIFLMLFNLIANLFLSRDIILDPNSKDGSVFFESTIGIFQWFAEPNMSDFFPILKWFDPQRIKRNMEKDIGRATKILEGFIKQKTEEHKLGQNNKKNKDFMDVLLEHEGDGPDNIPHRNMKILVLEMFMVGSETTSSTIEWAMAELLRHPNMIRKAKEEVDRVVGPNRNVEERDIDNLPYLQTVVKESTQVLVGAWAIGRDPETWKDPLSFNPDRFLDLNIDYKGQHFEFIPFGSGRRICMGIPLAHTMVPFVLASLLHSFDWELGSNMTPENIDMNEKNGITLRMLTPLKAIPKKRTCKA